MTPSITRALALSSALTIALGGAAPTADAGGRLAQARNPCAAKNPVAEQAAKAFKSWRKVNTEPVLSATHGNTYVFTYINKKAEPSALNGKFPFPAGSVLAKESFEGQGGKPGDRGPLFIMEKRGKGYDRANGDWHYAIVDPAGTVTMAGSGAQKSPTQFCAACHQQAKANDYVFGNGTTMKVKPTAMQAPAGNPCAATNPCAAKNPCAGRK